MASLGGEAMPSSVTTAVTSAAGVTSNARFSTATPSGANRRPAPGAEQCVQGGGIGAAALRMGGAGEGQPGNKEELTKLGKKGGMTARGRARLGSGEMSEQRQTHAKLPPRAASCSALTI